MEVPQAATERQETPVHLVWSTLFRGIYRTELRTTKARPNRDKKHNSRQLLNSAMLYIKIEKMCFEQIHNMMKKTSPSMSCSSKIPRSVGGSRVPGPPVAPSVFVARSGSGTSARVSNSGTPPPAVAKRSGAERSEAGRLRRAGVRHARHHLASGNVHVLRSQVFGREFQIANLTPEVLP